MKKILLLGGLRYLIPVIKSAKKLGYHVITCDNRPNNIAHIYSDEYHNLSIIDKDAVLKLANELKIDGIMSFAVDPGVITAAYVSESLGLPGNPYESVKILQDKSEFRKFLSNNHFNVPKAKGYSNINEAFHDLDNFIFPIIVKPVDSAGSKGVNRVNSKNEFNYFAEIALKNSILKREFIVEEFIERKGFTSDSDCFSENGYMSFISFNDQRFDINSPNPLTPAAFSWPSTLEKSVQSELKSEIQRLVTLLKMQSSLYNIEVRQGIDGRVYIMELSPRGGGNRLSEILKYSTGQDLIKNAILAAVGQPVDKMSDPEYNGFWAEIVLHSNVGGIFIDLEIEDNIKRNNLFEIDLWVTKGDQIREFNGANDSIGTLVLRFNTYEELNEVLHNQDKWLKIKTDK